MTYAVQTEDRQRSGLFWDVGIESVGVAVARLHGPTLRLPYMCRQQANNGPYNNQTSGVPILLFDRGDAFDVVLTRRYHVLYVRNTSADSQNYNTVTRLLHLSFEVACLQPVVFVLLFCSEKWRRCTSDTKALPTPDYIPWNC